MCVLTCNSLSSRRPVSLHLGSIFHCFSPVIFIRLEVWTTGNPILRISKNILQSMCSHFCKGALGDFENSRATVWHKWTHTILNLPVPKIAFWRKVLYGICTATKKCFQHDCGHSNHAKAIKNTTALSTSIQQKSHDVRLPPQWSVCRIEIAAKNYTGGGAVFICRGLNRSHIRRGLRF